MTLIRNLTPVFQSYGPLAAPEVWQCRFGSVLIAIGASPDTERGVQLDRGQSLEVPAGVTIFARSIGRQNALIGCIAAVTPLTNTELRATALPVSMATSPAAVGQGAEDAAAAGNAVRVGGRVRTASLTTLVTGDASDLHITTGGQLLVKDGGLTEAAWNASVALTTTTAAPLAAAAGAGLKRHLSSLQAINTGAAVVDLIILDGATERWRLPLPINVPVSFLFPSHLIVAANAALNANLSAAGTVRVNAQGYTGA